MRTAERIGAVIGLNCRLVIQGFLWGVGAILAARVMGAL